MGSVLVTGASSGFGLATSVELARRGHRVFATMREPARADRLVEAARSAGVEGRIGVRRLDVAADAAVVERAVREIVEASEGGLDALVNNAGVAAIGAVEDVPESEWRRVIEVNLFGALACVRACLPHMRARRAGTIVNLSSINGRIATPGLGPYNASKFALEALSETLRVELRPFGVHVVIVEPGQYATDIWGRDYDIATAPDSPYGDMLEWWLGLGGQPPPGAEDPADVARLIADIVEDPRPGLRYPVGQAGGARVDDLIRRHLREPEGIWAEAPEEAGGTG